MITPIDQVFAERGPVHGDYITQAALANQLKQTLLNVMLQNPKFVQDNAPAVCAAMLNTLDMVCVKMSRIAVGDPYYVDHWRDMEGYSKLMADRLETYGFSVPKEPTPSKGGAYHER